MAIRQEKYVIYVRPHIKTTYDNVPVTIFADSSTSLFIIDPKSDADCPHISLQKKPDEEFWIAYYYDNSLDKIRVKYKELIDDLGEEYVKVQKNVPTDTLIKPYA